jgi:flavin reductase (DIM6/NTAB) family NADH-FMN oxidoreductase RutF
MTMNKVQIGNRAPPMAMPVCLVGANVKGRANFCAVSWFTILNDEPPMIAVVLGKGRATMDGIKENGNFSVNIPNEFNVAAVDYCGINSGHDVDKSKVFGVSYGSLKTVPMADDCPLSAECKLAQVLEFPGVDLVVGEVVQVHVDKTLMIDGAVDVEGMKPLLYSFPGGPYLSIGPMVAEAFKVGKTFNAKK